MDKVFKIEENAVKNLCYDYANAYVKREKIEEEYEEDWELEEESDYQYWSGYLQAMEHCLNGMCVSVQSNYVRECIDKLRNEW